MKLSKGFTLIELLVAIAIIAILSALGLSTYQAVYKSSRDSRRQSDLKIIQSALEDFRADQLYYPIAAARGMDCSSVTAGTLRFGCPLANSDKAKTYINQVPSDPSFSPTSPVAANPNYSYVPSGSNCPTVPQNCLSYCLYAKMESANLKSDPLCDPLPPYNYSVTKP